MASRWFWQLTTVEGEIIEEALSAFRARANRVRAKLGAKTYELVDLRIDTGGGHRPPPPMRAMAMAESAAAPALEAGTSQLTARVQATIELTF